MRPNVQVHRSLNQPSTSIPQECAVQMHDVLEGFSGRSQPEVPPFGTYRSYASRSRSGCTRDRHLEACLYDVDDSSNETKGGDSQRHNRAEFRFGVGVQDGIGLEVLEVKKNDNSGWKGEDPGVQGKFSAPRLAILAVDSPSLFSHSDSSRKREALKRRQAKRQRCLIVE